MLILWNCLFLCLKRIFEKYWFFKKKLRIVVFRHMIAEVGKCGNEASILHSNLIIRRGKYDKWSR